MPAVTLLILKADSTATLADEGAVPIGESLGVDRVVVPYHDQQHESENESGDKDIRCQSRGSDGRSVLRNRVDIKDEPAPTHKYQDGPENQLAVGPLHRRAYLLGEGRLLRSLCGRSAEYHIRPSAANHDGT
jgi:hypothetical protein